MKQISLKVKIMLDTEVKDKLQVAINSKDSNAVLTAIREFLELLGFKEVSEILSGVNR